MFTLMDGVCSSVKINGETIPQQQDEVAYLGIYLDKKLTWAKHTDKNENN